MTEISSVAKEINSNALIKKHESSVSDLSLSLSSLSSVSKPLVSLTSSASSPVALSEITEHSEEEATINSNNSNLNVNSKFTEPDVDRDHENDKLDATDKALFITESDESVNQTDPENDINNKISDEESVRISLIFFTLSDLFFVSVL